MKTQTLVIVVVAIFVLMYLMNQANKTNTLAPTVAAIPPAQTGTGTTYPSGNLTV